MRCGGDNRSWFIFSPHVESEMRESTKEAMFQGIIEGSIRRTIKRCMSECHEVCVEIMPNNGGGMMRCWCSRVVECPYSSGGILGTVIQEFTSGITNGSTILVKCYGAVKIVCKRCDAL